MFGISPLGWIHTLGSLPAIPLAIYMFAGFGRIVPRSRPGTVYFFSMLIGALTVFIVAHKAISFAIGGATVLFLLAGYGIGRMPGVKPRAATYIETFCLSVTAFLLMVPTVTETLRRVPNGHPFVTDEKSPVLLGFQGGLLAILVIGLTLQMIYLSRKANRGVA